MKITNPKALVIAGDGLHGAPETATALELAKFDVEIRHLNDLILERLSIDEVSRAYSAIALPGGASFGDDLGAGKVLALKLNLQLGWDFAAFAARGGLVIGIGNGFQTLIRMGVFGKEISITSNVQGRFINTWTRVIPVGSRCVWLKGQGTLELPIRHAEGRLIIGSARRVETLDKMNRQGMSCLKYEENPIASDESLAGLCDPTGRIFGMMPHPEAFVRWTQYPDWTSQPKRASSPGQGLALFENAYQEALSSRG